MRKPWDGGRAGNSALMRWNWAERARAAFTAKRELFHHPMQILIAAEALFYLKKEAHKCTRRDVLIHKNCNAVIAPYT